ncbi:MULTISPECIES: hypothetical protein [Sulfitobacter]|uniref:Uncharacterized protein n=2 Tax=root TaxID=1 RepID=A0ABW1YX39_9RHOB|nr:MULTISPECIES: hypothetical protein [Sulfitobacter]UWR37268.1 hypothetical protein K3762_16190 [Sulfitobacter sp. W074]
MWWTFAASLVASCTALFIAVVVYPWQKSIDRTSQLAAERRALYTRAILIVADAELLNKLDLGVPNKLDLLIVELAGVGTKEFAQQISAFRDLVEQFHVLKAKDKKGVSEEYSETMRNMSKAITCILQVARKEIAEAGDDHIGLPQYIKKLKDRTSK